MEFWIAFGVIFVIGMLYKVGKRQNTKAKPTQTTQGNKLKAKNNPEDKLTQADEELITVILPTISHDK